MDDQPLGHLAALAVHQGGAEPLGERPCDGPAFVLLDVGEGGFQKSDPDRTGRRRVDIRLDPAGGVIRLRVAADLPGPGIDDAVAADDDAGGVQQLRRGLLAHGPDHALDDDPHDVVELVVESPPETVGVGPGLPLGQHQSATMIDPMGDGGLADLGDQMLLRGLGFLGGRRFGGAVAGGGFPGGAFLAGLGQADDALLGLVSEFLPRRGDHPADRVLLALPVPGRAMATGGGAGGVEQQGDDLVHVDVP